MILHFFEPPPFQTIGGLNLAIQSLKAFLEHSGVDVRSSSRIKELGESRAQEVVHFHGMWQPRFLKVSACCRKRGIRYVVSPHGMLEPWAWRHKWWKKWLYFHLIEKRHLARAHRLLATSDSEAHNLRKFFPASQCEVLPLGLPLASKMPDYLRARAALGWNDSELILLFLSRIHPKKGLHLLLAALAEIGSQRNQRARLVIVGGGEPFYLRKLRRIQKRHRSRLPRVDWVGEVWSEKKWAYLQGADLFCLPSYSENFGLAVLEALQVGTRVLTTDQTPWCAVPSWGAGWIVPATAHAVGAALAEYLARPEWSVEQRSQLAKETCDHFSWDKIGPVYLRFYEGVLESAPPKPH
jgi:glycosyltransferase involved in cell wall biosynthesis